MKFFICFYLIFCYSILTSLSWSQITHKVVISLNDYKLFHQKDELKADTNLYNGSPYTFKSVLGEDEFFRHFFHSIKKKRLKAYRDSECKIPFKYRDMLDEAYFLAHVLKSSGKQTIKPKGSMVAIHLRLSIERMEEWTILNDTVLNRAPQHWIVHLEDLNLEGKRIFSIYFKDVSVLNLELLNKYINLNGFPETKNELLVNSGNYNFRIVNARPQLPLKWPSILKHNQNNLQNIILRQPYLTIPEYKIQIPAELDDTRYKANLVPIERMNMLRNERLFQQLGPRLMRLILTEQLPLYLTTALSERVAMKSIIYTVVNHPQYPGVLTKESVLNSNYSYGLSDFVLIGVWNRESSNNLTFEPKCLGLVWSDFPGDPQASVIGYVAIRDLEKKEILIDNISCKEYFKSLNYYYFLYEVHANYIQDFLQSFYIDYCIRSNQWHELPLSIELEGMDKDSLEAKVRIQLEGR